MKAGELNRRITIQRATFATNALNEKVKTWMDLATVWASKKDLSDSERLQFAEVRAAATSRFQIRYERIVADIDARDRIFFEGRVYEIFGVKELYRKDGIEITAAARMDAAEHATEEAAAPARGQAQGAGEAIVSGAGSAGGSGG